MKQNTKPFISPKIIYTKFKTTERLTTLLRDAHLGGEATKKSKLMVPIQSSPVLCEPEWAYGRI